MDAHLTNWLIGLVGSLVMLLITLVGIMLRMHVSADKERMDAMDKREEERFVHFRDRIHDALDAIMAQDNKIVKLETIVELRKQERK